MSNWRIYAPLRRALVLAAIALAAALGVYAQVNIDPPQEGNSSRGRMRGTTQAQRRAARLRQAPQKTGVFPLFAGLNPETLKYSPLASGRSEVAAMALPLAQPDYFGAPNWANSPLPQLDGLGNVIPGTGVRKFVDTLPGLCPVTGVNDLGQCLPLATPFATPPAGVPADGDYYEIGLGDYAQQMHRDLPATKLRGYTDLNPASPSYGTHQYLGPVILATRNRPVRIKFTNNLGLGAAGDLFIPTDTTYMGAGMGPDGTMYSQNRATLHLHGGNTPWISDGTPHQWTVPAGETSTSFLKGVSARDVPDMPATGPGSLTFYWSNEQSGRLMFFHDHAYGLTRLNVYAGEAAGYLLVDPAQETALRAATVPGTIPNPANLATADLAHMIPLVIQDKTFVPDDGAAGGQLAATDPTWDVASYGGKGSLWFPHVYMPNQNPYDLSGANPFGRWDYGPWFWPVQDPSTFVPGGQPYSCQSVAYPGQWVTCPGTPNPSGTPEGFMDTPVVNGTAYPVRQVEPGAYRFQILNAANDRMLSLGLYYAATAAGTVCIGGAVADLSTCTEVSMVPAVPHTLVPPVTTPPTLPLCATATPGGGGGMLAVGLLDVSGNPLNGTGLPAACWPTSWPTDGRDGGVPDPTTAGPPIIQIGTEGGLLPAPVVIPSTPMGYEYNRRSITVLNVFNHGLLIGPAERADVVVDFSAVPPNSALIMYNDGPAPVPAFDPRVDYYTGDVDQSSTGGAPSTLPGYGPNTRTLLQFQVSGVSTNPVAFSLPTLAPLQGGIFASTQDQIIVPEPDYPVGNGNSAVANYARIQDTSLAFFNGGPVGGLVLLRGGGGYYTAPNVLVSGGGGTGATASAALAPAPLASVTVLTHGAGYTAPPIVTFTGSGSGAAATAILTPTSVAKLNIANPGSSYTTAPTVTIQAPTCSPLGVPGVCVQATANAAVLGGRVRSFTMTNLGAGYTFVPAVSITGGGGTGARAVALLTPTSVASVTVTNGGVGYSTPPTVGFSGGGGTGATAQAVLAASSVASLTLLTGGTGYTSPPSVTIDPPPVGPGALAAATGPSVPLQPKTIQELFTLDYGRMNATLGVELPFTNFLTQTTIPYGFVDPPTEIFKDGETQYWKITHNGVDSHVIHFHLFNVQVLNRIGWDGAIKPPDANELGWKDTVRMNPLEDVVVAMRALKQPTLPFALPNSVRPLDVTQPVGAALPNEFTNVDPANQPATVYNDLTNFGWEYVWHCHILGHEENDMMRPMSMAEVPNGPIGLTVPPTGVLSLVWTDNSTDETQWLIQRATSPAGPWTAGSVVVTSSTGPTVGGTGSYANTQFVRTGYSYRVIAENVVGYTRNYTAPVVGYPHVTVDSLPSNVVTK